MSYSLYRELIALTEGFENEYDEYERNIQNFSAWLSKKVKTNDISEKEADWEGKSDGRSIESIINTSLIHLYRYSRIYSKSAIIGSPFSTIDDIIFLINLLYRGDMTKSQLIEINIHEKSTGIQIINRLLSNSFIAEASNENDRRSKNIYITEKGKVALSKNMDKVRKATKKVVGNLNEREKILLMQLLNKLELFHKEAVRAGLD